MRLFYSSCPAGLEEPASRFARERVSGFSLKAKYSGALVYSCREERPECAAFSNTYLQIARADKCQNVTHAAKLFLSDRRALSDVSRAMYDYGFTSFRVMFSEANALAAVDRFYREAFEKAVKAPNDRRTPDTELLVLRRSDGMGLLLLRLTRPAKADKGELSRQVASSLAYLAGAGSAKAFIDPFAGGGSIAVEAGKLSKKLRIAVCDISPQKAELLRKRLKGAEVDCADAFTLDGKYPAKSFDSIACDPPWGLWAPVGCTDKAFCEKLVGLIGYLLAPHGRCAVLTAMKKEFEAAAEDSELNVAERFDILVNGKKAAVFVLRKDAFGDPEE